MNRLLCTVAHPDDECFAFGGALALAARRNIECYVVCLTEGMAGSHRGGATSDSELGEIRAREFADSCKVLGVHHHELWKYPDGSLQTIDNKEVIGKLLSRMRAFRPDLVLTFGADGGLNLHGDHRMVSFFATTAFHLSGQAKSFPEQGKPHKIKRLYHLSTNSFLPEREAPMPSPWTVSLDISSVKHLKLEAFEQHRTQAPLIEKTREYFREHGDREYYTLMAASEPQPAVVTEDLFSGLE